MMDGLDEFDGDHRHLIELIQGISLNPYLKICVSSRPWNVFRDAFTTNPSLQIQHLTKKDISVYVQDHFRNSPGFNESRAFNPGNVERLMNEVVEKTQGEFLCVSVVVSALLRGVREGDSISELQETLRNLPEDISQLFRRL